MPAPDGYKLMATSDQLRSTIEDALAGSKLALYLPPGSRLTLGGAPIAIGPIEVTILSGGEGAVLDAQHASLFFKVQPGAALALEMLTLTNGATTKKGDQGGVMTVDSAHQPPALMTSTLGPLLQRVRS